MAQLLAHPQLPLARRAGAGAMVMIASLGHRGCDLLDRNIIVATPAKAGVQAGATSPLPWIPAFAGMTAQFKAKALCF
jgi:hypothetical protein